MKSQILTWSAALGLTGFVCGFVGPILLQPGANQGPLVGILMTGPGGLLLGAVIGGLLGICKVRLDISRRLLAVACAVGAVAILYASLPPPKQESTLLDVEIRGCVPALSLRDEAFKTWESRLRAVTWAKPPADWRERFERAAASGSVVTVTTVRRREVSRVQTPWHNGDMVASEWQAGPSTRFMRPDEFYVEGSCANAPAGAKGVYLTKTADVENDYPPGDPASFLDMVRLEQVPANLLGFSSR